MVRSSCRSLFLSLLGAVYWCAFVSYYLQYPGLLGEDGLLPARRFWEQVRASRLPQVQNAKGPVEFDLNVPLSWWTDGLLQGHVRLPILTLPTFMDDTRLRGYLDFPCLLWFLSDGSKTLQVDQAMNLVALLGILASGLAVVGVHHVSVFLLLYLNYLTLFLLGQRWLSFQWDIFLLETGAMALLYCPFSSWRARAGSPPGAWLLRVLVAKFMYMNGVVKVTANCPTWRDLTALEFHFASTCLPTSEAWLHHQLPPFLLRMGVAVMFLTELPLAILLVFPVVGIRRFGVLAQAALQLGIIATGNYNWFNVHTIALLLPAWDADDDGCDAPTVGNGADVVASSLRHQAWDFANAIPQIWGRMSGSRLGLLIGFGVAFVGAVHAFFEMFDVQRGERPWDWHEPGGTSALSTPSFQTWTVKARFGVGEVHGFSAKLFAPKPLALLFLLVGVVCTRWAVAPLASRRHGLGLGLPRSLLRFAKVLLLMPALVLCLLPLEHVHSGVAEAIPFAALVRRLDGALANWHVATGYGLFRRMTGVGEAPRGAVGWGGLPPSVVAVPGVVVEGSDDGTTWREIPFRYALGSEHRQPRRMAPHQPRLDWQMWFAALGSYQHNDWFIHLMHKVLEGSEDVLALLDVTENPWPAGSKPPLAVRAWLYHYDFTRLDTPWARSIPGTRILNTSKPLDSHLWWTRKQVKQYFPPVTLNELKDVVKSQGWPSGKARLSALRRVHNCTTVQGHSPMLSHGCKIVVAARSAIEPLRLIVGWQLDGSRLFPRIYRRLPPWASQNLFVDVHFVAIVAPLLLLFCCRSCRPVEIINIIRQRRMGKLKQE